MKKILRNVPTVQKKVPGTLENTRPPADYKDAVIKNYNERYSKLFAIDAAKAFLIGVRQNSFKPWLATATIGENIYDTEGKLLTVNQRSTEITRQEYNKYNIVVTRAEGESPYETWKKVETAAGLEPGELEAILNLPNNATKATYKVAPLSLNWYGEVRVKFEYA